MGYIGKEKTPQDLPAGFWGSTDKETVYIFIFLSSFTAWSAARAVIAM